MLYNLTQYKATPAAITSLSFPELTKYAQTSILKHHTQVNGYHGHCCFFPRLTTYGGCNFHPKAYRNRTACHQKQYIMHLAP